MRDGLGYLIFEKPAGIRTDGVIRLRDLKIEAEGRVDSVPSPWLPLWRLIPRPTITASDVFVDFGSGKGRVVCQASMYPFGRVIGVELSEELNQIARANVAHHRRVHARSVEIVTADVLNWPLPDDLSVAYFFNPFYGDVFHRVVEKLLQSYDRNPRKLQIVYANPVEHTYLISTGRVRLVKHLRGWRPGKKWSRSNSASCYIVT